MQPLTLLKLFTFAGDNLQTFASDWVRGPSAYAHARMIVVVKLLTGSSQVQVDLEGSMDTDNSNVLAQVLATAPGTTVQAVGTMKDFIRIRLTASGTSEMVLSVYLIPEIS